MKKLVLVIASTMLATPAFAQVVGLDTEIDFTGERAIECSVTGLPDEVDFGALGRRGQADAVVAGGIDVFCNQPSEVSFTSDNGYLKLRTNNDDNDSINGDGGIFTSGANPGFNAGLDYSAFINRFGVGADSSDLVADTTVSLSPVPALNENNVSIRFDTIAGSDPLLGGSYEDELTITLTTIGV